MPTKDQDILSRAIIEAMNEEMAIAAADGDVRALVTYYDRIVCALSQQKANEMLLIHAARMQSLNDLTDLYNAVEDQLGARARSKFHKLAMKLSILKINPGRFNAFFRTAAMTASAAAMKRVGLEMLDFCLRDAGPAGIKMVPGVYETIEETLGARAARPILDKLIAAASGNPFLVRNLERRRR